MYVCLGCAAAEDATDGAAADTDRVDGGGRHVAADASLRTDTSRTVTRAATACSHV